MGKLKESRKKSSSSKKSDEILDELFSSIKEEKTDNTDSDDNSADESDGSTDTDSESRRRHKKKKKKHKKHKKKHKKRHRREDSEERRKPREDDEDGFWRSKDKVDELEDARESRKRSRRRGDDESDGQEKSRRRDRSRDDRPASSDHGSSRDGRYGKKREQQEYEYDDERRPRDLGRVALPYRADYEQAERSYGGSKRQEGDHYDEESRDSYDRQKYARKEYDRDASGETDRRAKASKGSERSSYDRPREDGKSRRSAEPSSRSERNGDEKDGFWDTKWDALQLEERIRKAEKKGQYYLNTKKRFKDALREGDGTPSLSPSPERGKRKKTDSSSESDTEEFKNLKKMRDIHSLKVDGDGLVEGTPMDASNIEYDKKTMMFRKKEGLVELEKKRILKDGNGEEAKSVKNDENDDGDSSVYKKEAEVKLDKEAEEKKDREMTDELVKDLEELENEQASPKVVETKKKEKSSSASVKVDWSNSALSHLKDDKSSKKKKDKKEELEDGEVDEGKEDGEVDSDDNRRRKPYKRKEDKSSRSRNRRRSGSRRRSYSRDRSRGRRRSYSRDRDRSRGRRSRERSSRTYSRRKSRSRSRRRSRSPYDRDRRSRYDRRSRSRSNDRREDRYERNKRRQEKHIRSKVNKEKLLEIAKKNAAKILKSGGDFLGMDQDRLIAMKSGGQSLDELTKFCKELAKKGLEDKEKIDLLAESESSSDEEFHHPFMVKERPLPNPITMLLGESTKEALPPAARAVAKSQRMLEFPVSSGNAHRVKESVDPVDKTTTVKEEKGTEVIKMDEAEMLKIHEQIEAEEKVEVKSETMSEAQLANAQNPLGIIMFGGVKDPPPDEKKPEPVPAPAKPAALPAPAARLALPAPAPPPVKEPMSSDPNKVFETPEAPVVDIGTIVSKRLNAMRKLQTDSNDKEALNEMYEAQKLMSSWASSKNKPGQFVGSTGAKILSKHELNIGTQCWARQDQFTRAEKVRGGFGEFMLKKMGWSDGEGLGKNRDGDVDPLTLDIKFDKKGLMAAEESKKGNVVTLTACKDLSGKHPVSALTELCSKRRWGPPLFEQAFDCGPPHKKQYIFKVTVNGCDYQPTVAVENKKKAKMQAAKAALQQMGLVVKDPDNPV